METDDTTVTETPEAPTEHIEVQKAKLTGDDFPLNTPGLIVPGENRLNDGLPPEPVTEEETPDAVREEETPPEVEEVKVSEEVDPDPDPDPEPDTKGRRLTEEELDNFIIPGKVDGVDKDYTLREVRDIYQTQEALTNRLTDANADRQENIVLRKQLLEAIQKAQTLPTLPTEPAEDFLTPEDQRLGKVEQLINNLDEKISTAETARLSNIEDGMVRSRVNSHFGNEDMQAAMDLIQRVKADDPAYGAIADSLFTGPPTSEAHVNQRVAFMDSLLIKGKNLEMPTIIEKVKEEGKKEGKRDLKREKKTKLASVETTQKVPDTTRADMIAAARKEGTQGYVKLAEATFIKELFPEL